LARFSEMADRAAVKTTIAILFISHRAVTGSVQGFLEMISSCPRILRSGEAVQRLSAIQGVRK
jgi:hypothetical protein